jgi:hypothetical protein
MSEQHFGCEGWWVVPSMALSASLWAGLLWWLVY